MLPRNANLIFDYLVEHVVPLKRVVTYGEVSSATGVPLGEAGGAVRQALYEIFKACDETLLPPLSAIVIQEGTAYDAHAHGMPGGGYLVAEAESENRAGRRRDAGFERWGKIPRPPDTDTWQMKKMIEAHQDSVWSFSNRWPPSL